MKTEFTLNGSFEFEPIKIHVKNWMPKTEPTKIIHILHGMGEHAGRYEDFAMYLTTLGYGVYAHDHRQHGFSVRDNQLVGVFLKEDNWQRVIEDVQIVQKHIRDVHKVPMVLIGHSMGSVIARNFLQWTDLSFESVVLSGVPDRTPVMWHGGRALARFLMLFNKEKPSKFLDVVAAGGFNKRFEPAMTPFDWLSRDVELCRAYVADPLCGYPYNPKLYKEFIGGFISAYTPKNIKKMPKIHTLFVTGSNDPVGGSRENMVAVFEFYQKHGLGDYARQMIFGDMRHEILNEIDKEKVYKIVGDFISE